MMTANKTRNPVVTEVSKDEAGQSMIIFAFLMVGIFSFLGLIVDVSNAYAQRRWMQNSADAAAIAGARILAVAENHSPSTEQQIWSAVQSYARKNGDPTTISAVFINPSGQQLGVAMPGNGGIPGAAKCTSGSNCATGVRVTSKKSFATFFLGVVNAKNASVDSVAAVQTGPSGAPYRGLMPVAVPRCYVDPNDPNPSLCGSHASTTSHVIVGQDAQIPSGSSSFRGIINYRDRLNSGGTQLGCADGDKQDASRYIFAGGYIDQNVCGVPNYNDLVDVLTGNSNGVGGTDDYAAKFNIGDKIIVCVYPEGTVIDGTKNYLKCIGFAQMQITALDSNSMSAIWTGTYYQNGTIDFGNTANFGGRALMISQ